MDHRNLLYMNNHGSRKVLQWKLDIQHSNATIEHVPEVFNTPETSSADLKDHDTTVRHMIVLNAQKHSAG